MKILGRCSRPRIGAMACPLLVGLSLAALPVHASDLTSASYRVVSPTLSGGGATGLVNPGTGATATADSTIAQHQPIGVSEGGTTGRELEMGFWHTTQALPEPAGWLGLSAGIASLGILARLRRRRRDGRQPR